MRRGTGDDDDAKKYRYGNRSIKMSVGEEAFNVGSEWVPTLGKRICMVSPRKWTRISAVA